MNSQRGKKCAWKSFLLKKNGSSAHENISAYFCFANVVDRRGAGCVCLHLIDVACNPPRFSAKHFSYVSNFVLCWNVWSSLSSFKLLMGRAMQSVNYGECRIKLQNVNSLTLICLSQATHTRAKVWSFSAFKSSLSVLGTHNNFCHITEKSAHAVSASGNRMYSFKSARIH